MSGGHHPHPPPHNMAPPPHYQHPPGGHGMEKRVRDYKLIIDPALSTSGALQKVYRYDGTTPGEPIPLTPRDPRSRMRKYYMKREPAELIMPKFLFDEYYIGTPLPKEVTFTNLNDNISQNFLDNMCQSFGHIEECEIFYHHKTRKHLGIGKVVFSTTRAAKLCESKLNRTTKMGKLMHVFVDPMGTQRQQMILESMMDRPNKPPIPGALPDTPTKKADPRRQNSLTQDNHQLPPATPMNMQPQTPMAHFSSGPGDGYNATAPANNMNYPAMGDPRDTLNRDPRDQQQMGGSFHSGGYPPQPNMMVPSHGPPHSHNHGPSHLHKGMPPQHMQHDNYEGHGPYRDGPHGHHNAPGRPNYGHNHRNNNSYNRYRRNSSGDRYNNSDRFDDRQQSDYGSFGHSHRKEKQRSRFNNREQSGGRGNRNRYGRNHVEMEHNANMPPHLTDSDYHNSPHQPHADPATPLAADAPIPPQVTSEQPPPVPYDEQPPPLPDEPVPPPPAPVQQETTPPPSTLNEEPRQMSLESRIQSLLQMQGADSADSQEDEPPQPPDTDGAPPLPPEVQPPPLPDYSEAPPPLPSHPPEFESHGMKRHGHQNSADDDRMSISSGSDGEFENHLAQWSEHYRHNMYNGMQPNGNPMSIAEEEREKMFQSSLTQLVEQLTEIVTKDLTKKMVQNSAYSAYDNWWNNHQNQHKAVKTTATSTTTKPSLPAMDQQSSLASLFDSSNTNSSGFGIGGLLGLRAGIPKMPSFKRFRPPPPVRKEEEPPRRERTPIYDSDSESEPEAEQEQEIESKKASKKPVKTPRFVEDSASDSEVSEDGEETAAASSEDESSEDESYRADERSEAESEGDISDEQEDEELDERDDIDADSDVPSITTKHKKHEESVDSANKEEEVEFVHKKKKAMKRKSPSIDLEVVDKGDKSDVESVTSSKSVDVTVDSSDSEVSDKESEAGDVSMDVSESGDMSMDVSESDEAMRTNKARDKSVTPTKQQRTDNVADSKKTAQSSVEEAAALALLEMGQQIEPSHKYINKDQMLNFKPKDAAEAQREEESAMVTSEHNYFAPPGKATGKLDDVEKSAPWNYEDSSLTDSASETRDQPEQIPTLPPLIALDHNYCVPFFPDSTESNERTVTAASPAKLVAEGPPTKKRREYKKRKDARKLKDVTNTRGNRELKNLLQPVKPGELVPPKPKYSARSLGEEMQTLYSLLISGIDDEDIEYIRQSYEDLLAGDVVTPWLNDIHWMDHPCTLVPDPTPTAVKKRRGAGYNYVGVPGTGTGDDYVPFINSTGSARTQGYYKISFADKVKYLSNVRGVQAQYELESTELVESMDKRAHKKSQLSISRDARSETRRMQNFISSLGEDVGELLKFNQLQFRKKQLKFAKSGIHDWGLFALEPILADEMVIEYVGEKIRQPIADLREKRYEAIGIGSSYLFRIDHDDIIDATKMGNKARFINHSCNPNCYAKIVSVEGLKKIVIYSKRDILVNEEITYDYKFPIEDVKIPCHCGSVNCRKTLN